MNILGVHASFNSHTHDPAVCLVKDGVVEFAFPFTVLPSFSAVANNSVSAIWYNEGTPLTSWVKVTGTGAGFAVTQAPPSLLSFSFDEASIRNDGVEVQTFRIMFANGGTVDETRFLINRPGHSENGRSYSGYFRVSEAMCDEPTSGLGNTTVQIVDGSCERNVSGAAVEFVVSFVVEPSFSPVTNNSVSAIWYSEGSALTGWNKVSTTDEGFDVTLAPPSLSSFTFDENSVAADSEDVQTFRLTLNQADGVVDEVRMIINRAGQTENGRTYDGYFTLNAERCVEQTAGLGNEDLEILGDMCEINVTSNGTVEYVVRFVISPSFGAATNNQVSAIWYTGGAPLVGWRKVTGTDAGFAVTQ